MKKPALLYLPRLRDENVLLGAIQEGVASLSWQTEAFANAEAWDDKRQRYQELRAMQSTHVAMDDRSLLVKPEAAAAQLAGDQQSDSAKPTPPTKPGDEVGPPPAPGRKEVPPAPPKPSRFHGAVPSIHCGLAVTLPASPKKW
jgi:hypothetical protein